MSNYEADIVIDGRKLTHGQAMAVRVAVSHLLTELADLEFRNSLGHIGVAYRDSLSEVQGCIIEGCENRRRFRKGAA